MNMARLLDGSLSPGRRQQQNQHHQLGRRRNSQFQPLARLNSKPIQSRKKVPLNSLSTAVTGWVPQLDGTSNASGFIAEFSTQVITGWLKGIAYTTHLWTFQLSVAGLRLVRLLSYCYYSASDKTSPHYRIEIIFLPGHYLNLCLSSTHPPIFDTSLALTETSTTSDLSIPILRPHLSTTPLCWL